MEVPLSFLAAISYNKIIIYGLIILVLVIFSAFFSMMETVFSSIQSAKLMTDIEDEKRGARKALWITENYDRVLSVILIGNNLVNIAISTLGLRMFLEIFVNYQEASWVDIVNTFAITIFVLIFGEIMPKTRGKKHSEKLALRYSGLLYIVTMILTPISYPFYKLNKLAMRKKDNDESSDVTSDDLENIIGNMEETGEIEEDEAAMLQNVLDLSKVEVKDIMTPRVDVQAIDIDANKEDIKKLFFDFQYSRIPVYKDTIDHIVGVLYEKDFFKSYIDNKTFSLKRLMTKPLFVVGSMHADDLLKLLKKKNVHMAIVIDEYGGFDGIVTMEDTLEELVGEIFDEHDDVPFRITEVGENHYLVNGDLEVENLFEELDFEDAPEDIEQTTIGGWVQDALERIPEVGDECSFKVVSKILYDELNSDEGIEYVNLHFTVNEVVNNRITVLDLVIEEEDDNKEDSKENVEEE